MHFLYRWLDERADKKLRRRRESEESCFAAKCEMRVGRCRREEGNRL
jgi:hypothetical protein